MIRACELRHGKPFRLFHPAFVRYRDKAGWIYLCKDAFDTWLDYADDDPDMEPLDFVILNPWGEVQ